MATENQPKIQITLGLTPGSQRQVLVFADTPEERDEALARLRAGLSWLELFEAKLQEPSEIK
jgi:hypothetical protein